MLVGVGGFLFKFPHARSAVGRHVQAAAGMDAPFGTALRAGH
jgi:hypothetical protein